MFPKKHINTSSLGSACFVQQMYDSAKIYYAGASFINPRFIHQKPNLTVICLNETIMKRPKNRQNPCFTIPDETNTKGILLIRKRTNRNTSSNKSKTN